MSTSFGWEGKGRYDSFRKSEIPWERVPYLSILEVWSRQSTIQIHLPYQGGVPYQGVHLHSPLLKLEYHTNLLSLWA